MFFILVTLLYSQDVNVPVYYQLDTKLSAVLKNIIHNLDLDKDFDVGEDGIEQISLAVIDLNSNPPKLGGVHYENFIYPASVYKMYVAAGVLQQISRSRYALTTICIADSPNVVDTWREIKSDPRPLLQRGDSVTVNYLLDLMITRSDNSAANCLIDLAGRKTWTKEHRQPAAFLRLVRQRGNPQISKKEIRRSGVRKNPRHRNLRLARC